MFESLFGNIKDKVNEHFDKKKLEREEFERMQREADFQQKNIFQEEFKKNALEVARAKAKKDAAELSGLQKMRAMNRAIFLKFFLENIFLLKVSFSLHSFKLFSF